MLYNESLLMIALITLCMGESPYARHEPHKPHTTSTATWNYVKPKLHSIPKTNSDTASTSANIESTKAYVRKSFMEPYYPLKKQKNSKGIQYAPVLIDKNMKLFIVSTSTKKSIFYVENRRSDLEPKINDRAAKVNVPRYNVDIPQSVNRYPGHNAAYGASPIKVHKGKQPYQKNTNQNKLYIKPLNEILNNNIDQTTRPGKTIDVYDFVPKQYKRSSEPYTTISDDYSRSQTVPLPPKEINYQHPKTHRMLMNVARTYNNVNTSLKSRNKIEKTLQAEASSHSMLLYNSQNDRKRRYNSVGGKVIYMSIPHVEKAR